MWKCIKCRESVEDAYEVCWSCGTSKAGIEDPEFEREVDVSDTPLPPAPEVPDISLKGAGVPDVAPEPCSFCGSRFLEPGGLTHEARFIRDSRWLQTGWAVRAAVCLDCGKMNLSLSAADIENLRRQRGE